MQTMFIAYIPGHTKPEVDQRYPSGNNYYTGSTLDSAMDVARASIRGTSKEQEKQCSDALSIAKVGYKFVDGERIITCIEYDSTWDAAKVEPTLRHSTSSASVGSTGSPRPWQAATTALRGQPSKDTGCTIM